MLTRSKIKALGKGGLTLVPGFYRLFGGTSTWGTDEARYCYSVWMRHLIRVAAHETVDLSLVAELGPGDSLGIGLTGLLTGVERYWALDVVEASDVERNLAILDDLLEMVQARADVPGADEYPRVNPKLSEYAFPDHLVSEEAIRKATAPARVAKIREELAKPNDPSNELLRYVVPWIGAEHVEPESVSYLFSQAVFEHVDDLPGAYQAMYSWLRPGGLMSHTIDYASHGLADEWNGHWQYGPLGWKIVRGSRPYLLNREPHATQQQNLHDAGFEIIEEDRRFDDGGLPRERLAARYQTISDIDLRTRGVFLVGRRPERS